MRSEPPSAPPSRLLLPLELRAARDVLRMLPTLVRAGIGERTTGVDHAPVIVVPGFGSDDRYTAPLRYFLRRLGFTVEGWGLGTNMAGVDLPSSVEALSAGWDVEPGHVHRGEACVPYLCDRFVERVQERRRYHGRRVSLVGWSFGGYLCREAVRDVPDLVDTVVTMGSPVVGGPKYTRAAGFFRERGMDLEWIEAETAKRLARPVTRPMTVIYSKTDAVVNWRAALDHTSERVRHVEVNAAHLGMGFNPEIWRHVVEGLTRRT